MRSGLDTHTDFKGMCCACFYLYYVFFLLFREVLSGFEMYTRLLSVCNCGGLKRIKEKELSTKWNFYYR